MNVELTTTQNPGVPSNEGREQDPLLSGDAFFGLLVAQLRSQDPFAPMDPTEFVGQLVQFNTLEQLIHIRQAVEAQAKS